MSLRLFRVVAAAVTGLALSATSACSGGGSSDSADRGSLVVASVTVPTNFDPHQERTQGTRAYWFLIFDRLTKLNDSMGVEPMLATEWTLADGSRSLEMKLRDDVTFHDGTAFDAEAVKVNVERAKSLVDAPVSRTLDMVESVEVVDTTTVRFNFNRPYSEFETLLAGPAGAMISPAVIAAGTDLNERPGDAGTGPYLLDAFVPGESATFVSAGDDNWDAEAGKLDMLEVRAVADPRTRLSALRAGEIDIAYIEPSDANSISEAKALGEGGEFNYETSPTGVVNAVLFQSAVLDDPIVRQAIAMGIDRKTIGDDLLQGTCEPTAQLARKGSPGYVEDFDDPYPFDPEAARKLLADNGYADGIDLSMVFASGRQRVPQILQQQLGAIDVRVELTPLAIVEAQSTFRERQTQSWQYNMVPDLSPYATVVNYVLSDTGLSGTSQELRQSADKLQELSDPAEREDATQEMLEQLASEAYFVPICGIDSHYLMADDVVDFDTAPIPYAQYMLDLRYVSQS